MPNRVNAVIPRRRGSHILVRLAVVVAAGSLFVFVTAQWWSATGQGQANVQAERHGVAYLQPLVQLVGELTDAQSAAVRGGQPDGSQMDAAMAAVDTVDDTHGDPLSAHRRWSELRGRIATLMGQHLGGEQAYAAYSAVVALAADLVRAVGDSSKLIPDPQLEAYYLADATLLWVPDVLVSAGRAADLAALAERTPSDGAQTRISVARYQVSVASEQLSASLHKALDSRAEQGAGSSTLGPNLAGQLDAFTSAVDAFVPPAMWLQTLNKADVGTLTNGAERVRQQTRPLAGAVLSELDSLLRDRQARLSVRQTWTLLGAGLGVLLLGVVLAFVLPVRPRPAPVAVDGDEDLGSGTGTGTTARVRPRTVAEPGRGEPGFAPAALACLGAVPDRAAHGGFAQNSGAPQPGWTQPGWTQPDWTQPGWTQPGWTPSGFAENQRFEDPFSFEELPHVGRAVRPNRRERDGDVR